MNKTEMQLAAALKIIKKLIKGEGVKEAKAFLKGTKDGTLPEAKAFHLTISQDTTIPAFGAYEAGTIPDGKVLLNLDAILWCCVDFNDLNWKEFAADCVTHELLHCLQDLLGKELNEVGINSTIDKLRRETNKLPPLNELAKETHEYAKEKGFYEGNLNIQEAICRIHGEVSELAEVYYKDPTEKSKHEGLELTAEEEEYADIILRTIDLCHYRGIDIEKAISLKMKYNKTRPYKHGKNI